MPDEILREARPKGPDDINFARLWFHWPRRAYELPETLYVQYFARNTVEPIPEDQLQVKVADALVDALSVDEEAQHVAVYTDGSGFETSKQLWASSSAAAVVQAGTHTIAGVTAQIPRGFPSLSFWRTSWWKPYALCCARLTRSMGLRSRAL